ncbi:LysR family transcriptional regulator [Pseudoduganella albidiflava]|uniref:LysR family transcriptional regulator n=1 Tax=Pseudoduganella albidiflava TaxID=321983 RepID=A0A411X0F1_9BURK|nr:LysR family transcriptional regulator [Pseudoduganella albidiflava]QBI02423.1 LysR family transcriptional regulator [Pseudoduganella albidiflava]GGY42957.1 LysR family transcriptional regulator [Pseudoduganella albidiflava]
MELRDLDLNLLLVFQEVFRERQISAAARRLRLTQSAVSNALARLRRATGDDLFVRVAAGMQPTPYAERMAEPVATALAHLEQALAPVQPFDPATSRRRFTIAMTDVGEVYFMPRLVELCGAAAPGVQIASIRVGTPGLREEMEAGRVDLAIGAFDDAPEALYQRRLFRQDHVCLFRAGHPLAAGPLTVKRLVGVRHLVVAALESPYDGINTALQKAGILGAASFSVPHFSAAPYIVSTTDLVVTVPQKLAERVAAPFGLVYVKSPLPLAALQTNVFWHRRYNQDEGNRWLRTLVVEAFGE